MNNTQTTVDQDVHWGELPDEDLVAMFRDWNVRGAFLALTERYRPLVLRHIGEFAGDATNVSSVCRAVFAEAALRISSLQTPAGFLQWLLHLARERTSQWVDASL